MGIHSAVNTKDTERALFLLQQGCNVNVTNQNGDTPIHLACRMRRKDFVSLLLGFNADVGIKNSNGKRPTNLTKDTAIKNLLKGKIPDAGRKSITPGKMFVHIPSSCDFVSILKNSPLAIQKVRNVQKRKRIHF